MNPIKGKIAALLMTVITCLPLMAKNDTAPSRTGMSPAESMYASLRLEESGLTFEIFRKALEGHARLNSQHKLASPEIVTIADLTQPSVRKRLYIIDIAKPAILFHTYVSHGKNSGDLFATRFSNTHGSLQSSQGFYVTGNVYEGKHGLSLQLHGQEPGFNDQAAGRAIVMHGANYVSEAFIKNTGRLGRSFGCPAVSEELAVPIINTIERGTCLFVNSNDPVYAKKSLLASSRVHP